MQMSHKDGRRADRSPRWASDPDAFEVFYRDQVRAVEAFVARRVSDRDRVADLTADVFVAAVDAADSFRSELGGETAWLFGIARYVVADEVRRDRRARNLELRIRGSELLVDDETYSIDERLSAEASSRALYAAMKCLPEGERAVLELVALDELSVAEAARILGIRAVTARVRLLRARRTMAPALEGDARSAATCAQPQEVTR
jgi:RNA polymerase sigma factor (sigma-70 family)